MKLLLKTVTALTMSAMMVMGANAMAQGEAYVGAKVGQFDVDFNSSNVSAKKPMAYGVYGGMNFTENFGAELDYVGSRKATVTIKKENATDTTKVQPSTLGVYGTVRYTVPNSNLYAKGKLGVARTKVKVDGMGSNKKTGMAFGVGAGYNILPNVAIEGEYTRLPKINNTKNSSLTLGVNTKF